MSPRSKRGEPRESLQAQVGYLTGKVETVEIRIDQLDSFIRGHMLHEEQVNQRQYKVMGILAIVVVLQSAGLSLKQIFDLFVAIL